MTAKSVLMRPQGLHPGACASTYPLPPSCYATVYQIIKPAHVMCKRGINTTKILNDKAQNAVGVAPKPASSSTFDSLCRY